MLKKMGTVSMVTSIAALALVAQAFAFAGGMGSGHIGGNMGGGQQMSSGMHATNGTGMQQGPMYGNGPQHMAMNGAGPQSMMQGGVGTAANSHYGQKHGSGSSMTTSHPSVTTTTK